MWALVQYLGVVHWDQLDQQQAIEPALVLAWVLVVEQPVEVLLVVVQPVVRLLVAWLWAQPDLTQWELEDWQHSDLELSLQFSSSAHQFVDL